MTRPQLSHHAWLEAEKTQEIPVPLIRYGDKQAVADEYHVEKNGELMIMAISIQLI